jgi:hypothetical protein
MAKPYQNPIIVPSTENLQYAAGIVDMMGSIQFDRNILKYSLGLVRPKIRLLHFMQDRFGGVISDCSSDSYHWILYSDGAKHFLNQIVPHMLVRKSIVASYLNSKPRDQYDDIPENTSPQNTWKAGVVDSQSTISKNNIIIRHRSKNLLTIFENIYCGNVYKDNNSYSYKLSTIFIAKLLSDIRPYIVLKSEQIDTILNAKRQLPNGVRRYKDKFTSRIYYNKTYYNLGIFQNIDQASEAYLKYKRLIEKEKKNGQKVEFPIKI